MLREERSERSERSEHRMKSSARMAAGLKDCPVDAAIVGVIDTIELTE